VSDAPADDHARPWTFDELVQKAISLIPAYAPQWTNHNPSDPGITLLELLAYFTEILSYRALRVTPDAKLHFLRLLEGQVKSSSEGLFGRPSWKVDEEILKRVHALASVECAVTPDDFEKHVLDAAAGRLGESVGLLARTLPGVDLRTTPGTHRLVPVDAPADVSVVLAAEPALPGDSIDAVCRHVQEALAPRCLLTSRARVVPARHLHVSVGCHLAPRPGVPLSAAVAAADAALRSRFDPLRSDGPLTGTSPFGRQVQLAMIAATIDRTREVDYVENVTVVKMALDGATEDGRSLVGIRIGVVARVGENTRLGGLVSVEIRRLLRDHAGEAEIVLVQPWELARVQLAWDAVQEAAEAGRSIRAVRHRRD
jgi:hypothetical protein